jgi:hypothetical protein
MAVCAVLREPVSLPIPVNRVKEEGLEQKHVIPLMRPQAAEFHRAATGRSLECVAELRALRRGQR